METFNQYVLDNWMLFVLIFVVAGAAMEGLKHVMKSMREAADAEAANSLKREMILRGMSADDILRVINRDFHFGRPGRHRYTSRAVRVGRICSWPMLQAPDTVSGVHMAVARAGSDRMP